MEIGSHSGSNFSNEAEGSKSKFQDDYQPKQRALMIGKRVISGKSIILNLIAFQNVVKYYLLSSLILSVQAATWSQNKCFSYSDEDNYLYQQYADTMTEAQCEAHCESYTYTGDKDNLCCQLKIPSSSYSCVNDDSTGDSTGDTCTEWYTSASRCNNDYATSTFDPFQQCCECNGGGQSYCRVYDKSDANLLSSYSYSIQYTAALDLNWNVDCSNRLTVPSNSRSSSISSDATATTLQQIIPEIGFTDWDNYFSTSLCPVTSCSLISSHSSITMETSSPWRVYAAHSSTQYSTTISMSCTNGAQTVQIDDWNVVQTGCSSTMSAPTFAASSINIGQNENDYSLTYDSSASSVSINPFTSASNSYSTFDEFFSNSKTFNCPITSCSLYESDCSTATQASDPVQMAQTSPWAITTNQAVVLGYDKNLCIKCSNGFQDIQYSPWKVKQEQQDACTTNDLTVLGLLSNYDNSLNPFEILSPSTSTKIVAESELFLTDASTTASLPYNEQSLVDSSDTSQDVLQFSDSQISVVGTNSNFVNKNETVTIKNQLYHNTVLGNCQEILISVKLFIFSCTQSSVKNVWNLSLTYDSTEGSVETYQDDQIYSNSSYTVAADALFTLEGDMHQFQRLGIVQSDNTIANTFSDGFITLVDGENLSNLRAITFNLDNSAMIENLQTYTIVTQAIPGLFDNDCQSAQTQSQTTITVKLVEITTSVEVRNSSDYWITKKYDPQGTFELEESQIFSFGSQLNLDSIFIVDTYHLADNSLMVKKTNDQSYNLDDAQYGLNVIQNQDNSYKLKIYVNDTSYISESIVQAYTLKTVFEYTDQSGAQIKLENTKDLNLLLYECPTVSDNLSGVKFVLNKTQALTSFAADLQKYEMSLQETFSSILFTNASAPFQLDSQTIYMAQLTLYDSNDDVLAAGVGDGFAQINSNGLLEITLTDQSKSKLSHKYYLEATFAPPHVETPYSPLIQLTNGAFSDGLYFQRQIHELKPEYCYSRETNQYWGSNTYTHSCSRSSVTGIVEWSADFVNGPKYVRYIQIIGQYSSNQETNGLEIYIGTTLCGTISGYTGSWLTYYCDVPVLASRITIKRTGQQRLCLCGVKVLGYQDQEDPSTYTTTQPDQCTESKLKQEISVYQAPLCWTTGGAFDQDGQLFENDNIYLYKEYTNDITKSWDSLYLLDQMSWQDFGLELCDIYQMEFIWQCPTANSQGQQQGNNCDINQYVKNSNMIESSTPSQTTSTNPFLIDKVNDDLRMNVEVKWDDYSSLKSFMIRASNMGGSYRDFQVQILVCGSQTIYSTDQYDKVKKAENLIQIVLQKDSVNSDIEHATTTHFIMNLTSMFSSSDNASYVSTVPENVYYGCKINQFSLCEDQECLVPLTQNSSLAQLLYIPNANLSSAVEKINEKSEQFLFLNTEQATNLTFFLAIKNRGQNTFPTQQITSIICGFEVLTLVDESNERIVLREDVESLSFENIFKNSNQETCPIVAYNLTFSDEIKQDQFDKLVLMYGNVSLDIDPQDIQSDPQDYPLEFELFILAQTAAGVSISKSYTIDLSHFYEVQEERSYNTIPQIFVEIEPILVSLDSTNITEYTLEVYDFQEDPITFSYEGIEPISRFTTATEMDQEGMTRNVMISIDPSRASQDFAGAHEIVVIANDGQESVSFTIPIDITLSEPEEEPEEEEAEEGSDSPGFAGVMIEEIELEEEIEEDEQEAEKFVIDESDPPPPPGISMGKISPQGNIPIDFNQPMITPDDFTTFDYSSFFKFTLTSSLDGSSNTGQFIKKSDMRLLSEQQLVENCDSDGCEAQKKQFTWYVDAHDENGMEIQTQFEDADAISTSSYGQDNIGLSIEKYGIFVSQVSGEIMDESGLPKSDCGDSNAQICKLMPPIIESEETVSNLDTASGTMETSLTIVTFSNLFMAIFLGGVIQQLYGMIKVTQIVLLQSCIAIVYPAHLTYFYGITIKLAEIDFLQGALVYEYTFKFKETSPFSPTFEQYEMGDMNFFMNSGSLLIIVILVIINALVWNILNLLAKVFYKHQFMRKIGIKAQGQKPFKDTLIKLFAETYIDIVLAAALNFNSIYQSDTVEDLIDYVNDFDNLLCTVITLLAFFLGIVAPLYISFIIIQNYNYLEEPEYIEKYGVYYEEYRADAGRAVAMFTVIQMIRRIAIIFVLIMLSQMPWLQAKAFIILSLISLALLINLKPYKDAKTNQIETFNEFTVFLNAHLAHNFMIETSIIETKLSNLKSIIGWVCIGNICFNAVVNMSIISVQSLQILYNTIMQKRINSQRQKNLDSQQSSLALLKPELDSEHFRRINKREEEQKAIQYCKMYAQERAWMFKVKIDFRELPEEIKFWEFIEKFKFEQRRKQIKEELDLRIQVYIINKRTQRMVLKSKVQRKLEQDEKRRQLELQSEQLESSSEEDSGQSQADQDDDQRQRPDSGVSESDDQSQRSVSSVSESDDQSQRSDSSYSQSDDSIENQRSSLSFASRKRPLPQKNPGSRIVKYIKAQNKIDPKNKWNIKPNEMIMEQSKESINSDDNDSDGEEIKPVKGGRALLFNQIVTKREKDAENFEMDLENAIDKLERAKEEKPAKNKISLNVPGGLIPSGLDKDVIDTLKKTKDRINPQRMGLESLPINRAIDIQHQAAIDQNAQREAELEKRIKLLQRGILPKKQMLNLYFEESFDFVVHYDFSQFDKDAKVKESEKNIDQEELKNTGPTLDIENNLQSVQTNQATKSDVFVVRGRKYLMNEMNMHQDTCKIKNQHPITSKDLEKWTKNSEANNYEKMKVVQVKDEFLQLNDDDSDTLSTSPKKASDKSKHAQRKKHLSQKQLQKKLNQAKVERANMHYLQTQSKEHTPSDSDVIKIKSKLHLVQKRVSSTQNDENIISDRLDEQNQTQDQIIQNEEVPSIIIQPVVKSEIQQELQEQPVQEPSEVKKLTVSKKKKKKKKKKVTRRNLDDQQDEVL